MNAQQEPSKSLPWIVRLRAEQRLIVALAIGFLAYVLQRHAEKSSIHVLIAWNLGVWTYLGLVAMLVGRADAHMTRLRVQTQDQRGYVIFLLVVSAAIASIVAIGFLMRDTKDLAFWPKTWHLSLSITALISAWLLIHTLFAFHYARQYYRHPVRDGGKQGDGLLFPGNQPPDYFDFTYYSFVIGMTSQVSDVAVTSRPMRRLTLVHGILSFIFNIAVLALSINIIASEI